MKKRLFIALTAFSMTLAGCDVPQNVVPPDDQNQEGGAGDSSGEGDTPKKEELTPEQKENANKIYTLIETCLFATGQDSAGIGDYITEYSEDVARLNYTSRDIGTVASIAMSMGSFDFENVVGTLQSVRERELLDDTIYFAVAFGKASGRAYALSNESLRPYISPLLDELDNEGTALPENLYQTVDVLLTSYVDFTSPDLETAIDSVFDEENEQIDAASTKQVLTLTSEALEKTLAVRNNVKYFTNLLIKLTNTTFAPETETRALLKEQEKQVTVDDVIDGIFDGVQMLVNVAKVLGDENNPLVEPVVSIANLIIKEQYDKAINKALSFVVEMGLGLLNLGDEIENTKDNAESMYQTISDTIDEFMEDEFAQKISALIDETTKAIDIETLKEVIPEVKTKLEGLKDLKDNLKYFDSLLISIASNVLKMFGEFSEDEIAEIVSKYNVSDEIEAAFGYFDSALAVLDSLDDEFYEFVGYINDKDYTNIARVILNKVFEFIGSSTTFEDLSDDVNGVKDVVVEIFEYFVADAFKAKLDELIDEEQTIDAEKLKAIIVEACEELEKLLGTKENVKSLAAKSVDVIKSALAKYGLSEEEINRIFEDFDSDVIIEGLFEKLSEVISFVKDLGNEESELDAYIPLINSLIAIISAEDIGSAFSPIYSFLVNGFTFLFDKLGMEDKEPTQYATDVLMLLGSFVSTYMSFSSEEFINKAKAIYNSETNEVDFDALEVFLTSIGTNLSIYAADQFKDILFEFVDLFREIASKLQPEDSSEEAQIPKNIEATEDEEEQGEPEELEEPKDAVKDAITEFVNVMKSISGYLDSENEQFKADLALVKEAYDVVMAAVNNISAIAGDIDKKVPEKAAEIYDEVLNAIKGLLEVAKKIDPKASEYEQYIVNKYVEFAKEVVYVIANVIENGPSVIEEDFVIELASYITLALPGSSQGSANSCNIDYFDNVVMPGVLPVEEIKQALANKEEGEWEAELKELSVSFEKITVVDGEETRVEYCLSFNTLKSYHISNTVVDDENVLSVEILYDYVSVKIPSLDYIPTNVFAALGLLLFLSGSIDEKIDEYTSYINKFIQIYKAVTEGKEQKTTFDDILNLVEQFSKEDGALVKTLYKDVLFAVLSLVSAFVPNGEKVAQIDFTSYLFNAFIKLDLIPEKSFTEGQVESFKALLKDVYEVASIFGLRDELITFLKETFLFDDIEEFETSDEFVEYFDEIFAELIIPSETPELGA